MTNGSSQPIEKIHQVLEIWSNTPGLNAIEASAIQMLRFAQSVEEFESLRHTVCTNYFPYVLSAIAKARAAGILRKWPS